MAGNVVKFIPGKCYWHVNSSGQVSTHKVGMLNGEPHVVDGNALFPVNLMPGIWLSVPPDEAESYAVAKDCARQGAT